MTIFRHSNSHTCSANWQSSTCFTRSVKHCFCVPCWPVIPPGKGREGAVRWDCSPVYVEREEEAQEAQEDLPMRVWVDVVHLCYQLHAAITASISITRHSGQHDMTKAQLQHCQSYIMAKSEQHAHQQLNTIQKAMQEVSPKSELTREVCNQHHPII